MRMRVTVWLQVTAKMTHIKFWKGGIDRAVGAHRRVAQTWSAGSQFHSLSPQFRACILKTFAALLWSCAFIMRSVGSQWRCSVCVCIGKHFCFCCCCFVFFSEFVSCGTAWSKGRNISRFLKHTVSLLPIECSMFVGFSPLCGNDACKGVAWRNGCPKPGHWWGVPPEFIFRCSKFQLASWTFSTLRPWVTALYRRVELLRLRVFQAGVPGCLSLQSDSDNPQALLNLWICFPRWRSACPLSFYKVGPRRSLPSEVIMDTYSPVFPALKNLHFLSWSATMIRTSPQLLEHL